MCRGATFRATATRGLGDQNCGPFGSANVAGKRAAPPESVIDPDAVYDGALDATVCIAPPPPTSAPSVTVNVCAFAFHPNVVWVPLVPNTASPPVTYPMEPRSIEPKFMPQLVHETVTQSFVAPVPSWIVTTLPFWLNELSPVSGVQLQQIDTNVRKLAQCFG